MSSSGGDVRFAHTVFAVREDKDGRQPEFLDQPFKLNAVYHSSTSILFRLSVAITDNAFNKITIYLQITPDRIASLRHTTCDTTDTSNDRPPCLERVRQRLGAKRLMTRLQLRLHSGLYAQLIAPTGFTLDEIPESPVRHPFASAASLATASIFSLYVPHNVLPMTKIHAFVQAVQQFPNLTAAQRQLYERRVDLRRLYNGKGGIVLTPQEVQSGSLLRDREHSRATTPATSESCASTVPFDAVPRYQETPPQYEERINDGQQPQASLAAAAFVKELLGCDNALPEYSDTEQKHNVPNASKRWLHCGSEDIDLNPRSKRTCSERSFTSIYTTPSNAHCLEEKPQPQHVDPECSQSGLMFLLKQQCQQIERLQADIEELKRRNKELQVRHDEAEDNCCKLENRQSEIEETVESLLIHTGELDDECEKLGKQMPDICDDMEDWVKDNLGNAMKEHVSKWLEENMAETVNGYIDKRVAAKITHMKAKMRKALQD
ncbi:hypothetical protein CORC01_13269 [Colletotrichum orchidophilum]|uniref:Uncharacterized protein n=1 Tax=Colletotrichum orchidophilum TaxID=1209926 RepID=A0A1G4AQK5_9PEZI|nr:uncharacterized protein CORC01_13269 [Colletotrichum orchidophilum]OHE91450.1 hypothetical protein CORC01_13269 [Colletotrichum orchidophilum]